MSFGDVYSYVWIQYYKSCGTYGDVIAEWENYHDLDIDWWCYIWGFICKFGKDEY